MDIQDRGSAFVPPICTGAACEIKNKYTNAEPSSLSDGTNDGPSNWGVCGLPLFIMAI
jgi:hypothetical protein